MDGGMDGGIDVERGEDASRDWFNGGTFPPT